MKKNMGAVDRTLRTLLAVILAILVLAGVVKGTLAYILVVVAIVFLATSLFGFCPLYVPLGITTLGRKKSEQ
ncbi:MAG: DUF2892 domain-containing protein [Candidatus Saccharicenans sp.]|jgi:hypothetical protein|nr:DUF2892 domain-containing protein [Candidatus Saccharicenans sp.]MDH7575769.1 DUF2892 domain-containing protein [Candidatus Saccharicenans sp.]NPV83172.1 DUF2892 domain-containing protein [Candidatus Aminicenantes bacterium]